jgi:uncharacterized protein (DUF433 family)
MNAAIETSHVAIDDRGLAWVDDTNVKVVEVVRDHLAYGWSPEEIHWQHPHLSLAQIYAALAYYHDHRPSMDAEIRNSLESANASARLAVDSPLVRRLQGLSRYAHQMRVNIGQCIHDLHLLAECVSTTEMANQVVHLPIK